MKGYWHPISIAFIQKRFRLIQDSFCGMIVIQKRSVIAVNNCAGRNKVRVWVTWCWPLRIGMAQQNKGEAFMKFWCSLLILHSHATKVRWKTTQQNNRIICISRRKSRLLAGKTWIQLSPWSKWSAKVSRWFAFSFHHTEHGHVITYLGYRRKRFISLRLSGILRSHYKKKNTCPSGLSTYS